MKNSLLVAVVVFLTRVIQLIFGLDVFNLCSLDVYSVCLDSAALWACIQNLSICHKSLNTSPSVYILHADFVWSFI